MRRVSHLWRVSVTVTCWVSVTSWVLDSRVTNSTIFDMGSSPAGCPVTSQLSVTRWRSCSSVQPPFSPSRVFVTCWYPPSRDLLRPLCWMYLTRCGSHPSRDGLSRAGHDLELQQGREATGVAVQAGVHLGGSRRAAGHHAGLPDVVVQQSEVEPRVPHQQRHVRGQRGPHAEGQARAGVKVARHGLQEVALVPAVASPGEGRLVGGALLALYQVPARSEE